MEGMQDITIETIVAVLIVQVLIGTAVVLCF
jgi:hypothetical protein